MDDTDDGTSNASDGQVANADAGTAIHAVNAVYVPTEWIARWRPFVQWILVLPHVVVLDALSWLRCVLNVVGSVIVVFTGSVPRAVKRPSLGANPMR